MTLPNEADKKIGKCEDDMSKLLHQWLQAFHDHMAQLEAGMAVLDHLDTLDLESVD